MKNKTLIFLCGNYPLTSGEFFIDDEMQIIADRFEKIIVVIKEQQSANLNSFMPENMQVVTYSETITFLDKIKSIPYIIKPFFLNEFIITIRKYKLKPSVKIFKIMFMDVVRATKHKKLLQNIIKRNKIIISDTIFYSYWHHYKALALALLKKENKRNVCISRAHGWDVFKERHTPPYLPFKNFIISNLNQTFSVSNAGKIELEKMLTNNIKNKITVSRLGKINQRKPNLNKLKNEFTICSCSNLIPLKRVNLIIDILSKIPIESKRWVHFGDGYLHNELERYAKIKLVNIEFIFKGIVPNSEILDFYSKNYIDLFINISESEGIPISIMEALSAGIPVLATNVGGTSEIVNKNVGFLIDKDFEITEVARIIENYLNSPIENQKTYREKAYRFWKENYTAEKNYTDFVNQILLL